MLRPSPVPQFISSNSTRSISPINISNSQQNLGLTHKERTNSFGSIQPTSNPLSQLQNVQQIQFKQQTQSLIQNNIQNENKLVMHSNDLNKFFQNSVQQGQYDSNSRVLPLHPNQIKSPSAYVSNGSENRMPLQENNNRLNSINIQNSPKQNHILSITKPTRINKNGSCTNILLPPTQQSIPKSSDTPKSSTNKHTQILFKQEATDPHQNVVNVGSLTSFNTKEDENQNIEAPSSQNHISYLNKFENQAQNKNTSETQIQDRNEQPFVSKIINNPAPIYEHKVLVNSKIRSNSQLCGSSSSMVLPTFSTEYLTTSTINNPQMTQIQFQQQQYSTLAKNRSSSIISEGTSSSQGSQIISNQQQIERGSFNNTQPLPPSINKQIQQSQNDKQLTLIHDLQQKILILLNENEKVNTITRQKQIQINQLESQSQSLKEQNDNLKLEYDAQSKIGRDLQKEIELQMQNENLQEKIKELANNLEDKNILYENILKEKRENQVEYNKIIESKEINHKQFLIEMEAKITMLVDENNKLNEIVSNKVMKESSVSQQPYSEEQEQQIQILIQENQNLEQIINNLEQSSNELTVKYKCSEQKFNQIQQEYAALLQTNNEFKNDFNSFEEKIKALLQENQKLIEKINEQERHIIEQKNVEELKQENEILLENLKQLANDKQKIQFEMQKLDENHKQQQAILLEQYAEQANIIQEKSLDERTQFEQRQEESIKEKEELLLQFDKFKEENANLAKNISDIEDKIEILITENQELNSVTQIQRNHIETLEKRQETYTEQLRKQFDISLRQKIEENLMQLTNRYNEEINKLHNEIIKKNESLVEEKQKNTIQEGQINNLKSELNVVNQEIQELKEFANLEDEQEYDNYKKYQQQLEFENNELKNKIENLEQDKQLLTQQLEQLLFDQKNREQLIQEYQQQILNSDFSQGNNNMQIQQLIQTQNELIDSNLKKDDENKELLELIHQTKYELDTTIQQYQQLIIEHNQLQLRYQTNTINDEDNYYAIQSLQKENDQLKKEREELISLKKKQQIELSKKNKELIERREELDQLQLKLEQSFSQNQYSSYYSQQNSQNQQVLSSNMSQKLNMSSQQNMSINQQKSNYRN